MTRCAEPDATICFASNSISCCESGGVKLRCIVSYNPLAASDATAATAASVPLTKYTAGTSGIGCRSFCETHSRAGCSWSKAGCCYSSTLSGPLTPLIKYHVTWNGLPSFGHTLQDGSLLLQGGLLLQSHTIRIRHQARLRDLPFLTSHQTEGRMLLLSKQTQACMIHSSRIVHVEIQAAW